MDSLIKFEGKPIEKLIEVISKGIGTLYEPRRIKKEADAKAYEIQVIEKAKTKAALEKKQDESDFYERIENRLVHKEVHRQSNLDNIVQVAAEQISQQETVSSENVNRDWTARFFNIVQDISDEEMQKVWGRILAGEVKQPNSFSLRTLELLKNLTQAEAEIFSKAAPFAITSQRYNFFLNDMPFQFLKVSDITPDDLLLLEELGLITSETTVDFKLPVEKQILFWNGNIGVKVWGEKIAFSETVYLLTKPANELLTLITPANKYDYMQTFAKNFIRKKLSASVGIKQIGFDGTVGIVGGETFIYPPPDYFELSLAGGNLG